MFCLELYFVRNYVWAKLYLGRIMFFMELYFGLNYILHEIIFLADLYFAWNYIFGWIIFCTLTIGCAAAKTPIYSPELHWHKWQNSLLSFFGNNVVLWDVSSDASFTYRSCLEETNSSINWYKSQGWRESRSEKTRLREAIL